MTPIRRLIRADGRAGSQTGILMTPIEILAEHATFHTGDRVDQIEADGDKT